MLHRFIFALFCSLLALAAGGQNPIHEIKGSVLLDQNSNCIADASDQPLENWFLRVESGGGTFSVETDATGFYHFFVPDGSYQVRLEPLNRNFSVCASASQSVTFNSGTPQSATFDFVAKAAFSCPRLRTELSAANVQPCSTAIIKAFYRNDGTATAPSAFLTVNLDRLLTFQSATPAPSAVVGGKQVQFSLGNLPPTPGGAWKSVEIRAKVSCDARPGAQVGAEAQATPNVFCSAAPGWSGAIITATGICSGGTETQFTLQNIGNAPSATLEFTIVEDQIVLRQSPFQLDPGETHSDTVASGGQPVTIIAQQEPGFPGDSLVTFTVYNCGGASEQGIGLGGSPGPFGAQEGFRVLTMAEQNGKSALPPGFGASGRVQRGTPLEYRIAFQNTGTGPAASVLLRDTLDARLDFGKIEPRGSSHLYDFAQLSDSVVQFTFSNIQLPPAATNPEGSKGFVEFLVYPKPDLLPGTVVLNRAAARFDQSQPLLTNTVRRIYDTLYLVKVIDNQGFKRQPILVYPNPFVHEVTFELPDDAPAATYRIEIFDLAGRLLRADDFSEKKCLLSRAGLPGGVLLWTISSAGKMAASGRIVASE